MESQSFPRGTRHRYTAAFKCRLVALACEPGASVAELSRTSSRSRYVVAPVYKNVFTQLLRKHTVTR